MRFGKLVAIERDGNVGPHAAWLLKCDCGRTIRASASRAKRGAGHCGCSRRPTHFKHGLTKTAPEYRNWISAKSRCYCETDRAYSKYGGRGIGMADEWRSSFERFLADMGPRAPGTSLDRIDNARGYEPGNCRWATAAEQVANRGCTIFVEHEGERLPLKTYCERVGANYNTVAKRLERNGGDPKHTTALVMARALISGHAR